MCGRGVKGVIGEGREEEREARGVMNGGEHTNKLPLLSDKQGREEATTSFLHASLHSIPLDDGKQKSSLKIARERKYKANEREYYCFTLITLTKINIQ